MFGFWRRLRILYLIAFFGALIAVIIGPVYALFFCCIALVWLVVYHTRNMTVLEQWLQISDHTPSSIPSGTGAWEKVFAHLKRYVLAREQNQQRVNLELEQLQNVIAAMPDGIVILDESDRIVWCDPAAGKHLGINMEIDAGQHITNLVRQRAFVDYLTARKFNKVMVLKQMRHHRLTLLIQLVSYGDKQKLLISRDITSYERLDAMRRDFIANVSHELRTPLTVIGGYLEMMSTEIDPDPKMHQHALIAMSEQATRMQRLVEDLLTLSRLENTLNKLNEAIVDIALMVRDLKHEAESLSSGKHTINLNIASEDEVLGSREELRSAFSNLISNAIRYTPKGGEVSIIWKIQGEQGVFVVKDTGVGIEPEHIPRLTERFYRVDNSRSRETGGTGLGLAIVKHVLNRHQARLKITSEVGKGSQFTILIPKKRLITKT